MPPKYLPPSPTQLERNFSSWRIDSVRKSITKQRQSCLHDSSTSHDYQWHQKGFCTNVSARDREGPTWITSSHRVHYEEREKPVYENLGLWHRSHAPAQETSNKRVENIIYRIAALLSSNTTIVYLSYREVKKDVRRFSLGADQTSHGFRPVQFLGAVYAARIYVGNIEIIFIGSTLTERQMAPSATISELYAIICIVY